MPASYPGFLQPGIAGDPMNRGRGRGSSRNQVRRGPGGGKGFGRKKGRGKFRKENFGKWLGQ